MSKSRRILQRLAANILSICLISSSGCMSMQKVQNHAPGERPDELGDATAIAAIVRENVSPGDKVEIIQKDGYINTFTVGSINEYRIAGNDEFNSLVSIEYVDIEAISVEQIDGGRTLLAVAGGVVAIPIVLFGAGMALMIGAMGSGY